MWVSQFENYKMERTKRHTFDICVCSSRLHDFKQRNCLCDFIFLIKTRAQNMVEKILDAKTSRLSISFD